MFGNKRFNYTLKNGHTRITITPKKLETNKITTVKHRDVVVSSNDIDDDVNRMSQLTQESRSSQHSHEAKDSKFMNTTSK